jgi:hypothetical protein
MGGGALNEAYECVSRLVQVSLESGASFDYWDVTFYLCFFTSSSFSASGTLLRP